MPSQTHCISRAAHAETAADSPDASDPPGSNISIPDLSLTAMAHGTYPKARYYGGDAPGGVYVKSRRAKRTTRPSQTEHLPRDISDIELKVGHAKNLPRRVQQYRKCESAAQEIVWHGFFYAERRMHVGESFPPLPPRDASSVPERRIHLALERHGAVRIRGECRGYPCTTHHREYFNMRTIRTRAEFLRICREELRAAREKDLKLYVVSYQFYSTLKPSLRHPLKDWYPREGEGARGELERTAAAAVLVARLFGRLRSGSGQEEWGWEARRSPPLPAPHPLHPPSHPHAPHPVVSAVAAASLHAAQAPLHNPPLMHRSYRPLSPGYRDSRVRPRSLSPPRGGGAPPAKRARGDECGEWGSRVFPAARVGGEFEREAGSGAAVEGREGSTARCSTDVVEGSATLTSAPPLSSRDPRDIRDVRTPAPPPPVRDTRDLRDAPLLRDTRDSRDLRPPPASPMMHRAAPMSSPFPPRDVRDARDPRAPMSSPLPPPMPSSRDSRASAPLPPRDSRDVRDAPPRDPRDVRDARAPPPLPVRDARDAPPPRDLKEREAPAPPADAALAAQCRWEERDLRDPRDMVRDRDRDVHMRDAPPLRGVREAAPMRDVREAAPMRDVREAAPMTDVREAAPMRDPRDAAPMRDPRDAVPMRDPRDVRDHALPMRDPRDAPMPRAPLDYPPPPRSSRTPPPYSSAARPAYRDDRDRRYTGPAR
ncbi:hypothetical protein C8R43DRAFT_1142011 [Mycena crocata]|nr:hypothetical protein C8R43DRAFT_1142011 [Mycena crocata]